jgi:hypothetical protein
MKCTPLINALPYRLSYRLTASTASARQFQRVLAEFLAAVLASATTVLQLPPLCCVSYDIAIVSTSTLLLLILLMLLLLSSSVQ